MQQPKSLSRVPSMDNLQQNLQRKNIQLSEPDMKMLFINSKAQKMDLACLNTNSVLHKKPQFKFFYSLLENWNNQIILSDRYKKIDLHRIRFIYASLMNICLMCQSEINCHLQKLTEWYSKNMRKSRSAHVENGICMPKTNEQKCLNQFYQVQRNFKGNYKEKIQEYKRPKFITNCFVQKKINNKDEQVFAFQNKQISDQNMKTLITTNEQAKKSKISFQNNFLTEICSTNNETFHIKKVKKNWQKQNKMLVLNKTYIKKRQNHLIQHLEKKQIDEHSWRLKFNKSRMASEASKNFSSRRFSISYRNNKSMRRAQNHMRAATSLGNRELKQQQKKPDHCQLNEVCSLGLMKNPLLTVLKKKNKLKK